jgi:hypothetical protein
MSTNTYQIPKRFYDDHVDRDLPGGTIIKSTKRHYTIELSDADRDELLSDADYYTDQSAAFDPDLFGVIASARATARAIRNTENAA